MITAFRYGTAGTDHQLNSYTNQFGATMAALAHFGAVVGMIAFFELLWYLERWSASHTVLGIIAVVAVQRCVFKILIAVFLSREFKHDETNRAWWTVGLITDILGGS